MKRQAKATITLVLTALFAATAGAVPAKQGVLQIEQADGTVIEARLVGDERAHQYFTPDGYLLASEGGNFYYGLLDAAGRTVSSGIRATAVRDAAASAFLATQDREQVKTRLDEALSAPAQGSQRGPGLFPETRFPAIGEQKAIVILVNYADVQMQVENPHDYFDRMLNEEGFSLHGGTGSARDFFVESSMGQFVPQFDLYGPVTLSQNRVYYGGNSWGGDDQRPAQMIYEACQLLDDEIDFSQYDRDNDGYIDNVFVFYAGRGEASGGGSDTVWPHSWTVSAGMGYSPTFDGVKLDRYACSNEWEGSRPDGVGTFVHEFSHVMGLPDLYATSYTTSFTPGAWSAMDYGPYNNDGCTPPLYSAFERYALNWMEPVRISGPMNATLPPIGSNVAGIVVGNDPNEYFLFENRQQTGWDTYIPGHGMLVWHVDYDSYVWKRNQVNNTPSHQYVDIEEADGSQSEYSRNGDAFPGASGKTSFTDDTTPSMRTWNGTGFSLPITEIAESSNGTIAFKVCGGATAMDAPDLAAGEETPESFVVTWTPIEGTSLLLSVFTKNSEGVREFVQGYENRDVGTSGSHTVEGLEPMTDYYVEGALFRGLETSPASAETNVYTGRPTLDRITAIAIDADGITDQGFTARWEAMPEANNYFLSVFERVFGAPYSDVCDFTDGTSALPEGWSASTPATYANSAYSGAAVPAIRLGKGGDNVVSATFDDGIRGYSFWNRGNGTSDDDRINVMLLGQDGWFKHADYPITTTAGGATVSADDVPEGCKALRVEFIRSGTKGAVAVDDITVLHGRTYSSVPLEDMQDIATGNKTSYEVTGLKANQTYTYRVVATDGTLNSRPSNEVLVLTKESSGIGHISAACGIATVGLDITVSGVEANANVVAFDLTGRHVAGASASSDGTATISVPSHGLYIVRAGTKAYKVIL